MCSDIFQVSFQSLCSQGGGSHQEISVFTITVDRFLDPVPEPGLGALALGALAAVALRARGARS